MLRAIVRPARLSSIAVRAYDIVVIAGLFVIIAIG
jgi:hypothetical protein